MLIQIQGNDEAVFSDRLLASKTLWQVMENTITHLRTMADTYKYKFLSLEHEMQKERALNHLMEDVKDIDPDQLMLVLQRILEKKGKA